jgi:hypothetical protein
MKNHFFLTSVAQWLTTGPDRTLAQAVKAMDKDGYPYTIWAIPAPPDADYEIEEYRPKVEGALFMERVEPAPRKR